MLARHRCIGAACRPLPRFANRGSWFCVPEDAEVPSDRLAAVIGFCGTLQNLFTVGSGCSVWFWLPELFDELLLHCLYRMQCVSVRYEGVSESEEGHSEACHAYIGSHGDGDGDGMGEFSYEM